MQPEHVERVGREHSAIDLHRLVDRSSPDLVQPWVLDLALGAVRLERIQPKREELPVGVTPRPPLQRALATAAGDNAEEKCDGEVEIRERQLEDELGARLLAEITV